MRIGLGYIEAYKVVGKEKYVCGRHAATRRVVTTELLLGDSKNTGFVRTLDLVAGTKYGDLPAYLVLGTGTQPKTPTNPYLDAEVMRIVRSEERIIRQNDHFSNALPEYWWVREHTYVITPASDLTISEWGVSESGTANDPLVAGGIFPTPITLSTNEVYVFRYRTLAEYATNCKNLVKCDVDPGDFIELFLTGATQVTHNGELYELKAYSAITSTPTFGSYVAGSYKRSCSFSVSDSDGFKLEYTGPAASNSPGVGIYANSHLPFSQPVNSTKTIYVAWSPTSDF